MKIWLLRGKKTNKIYRTYSDKIAHNAIIKNNFEYLATLYGYNISFNQNLSEEKVFLIKRKNGELIDE